MYNNSIEKVSGIIPYDVNNLNATLANKSASYFNEQGT
jgi:hypothetical protein